MKKLISITSTVMSLALAFNFFSVSCVKAAQVELYGLRKNCFLERDTSYSFVLSSGRQIKDVQVKYHCQPIGGWVPENIVYVSSYNLNSPVYVFDQGVVDTSYIQRYGPWVDHGFIGNRLEFIVTHPDNSTSSHSIRCNVLDANTSWYYDRDTTFFYSGPNNNSFVSYKTGSVSQFSGAVYNCLAYALHIENEGFLWPFNSPDATNSDVVNYLYNRGYNQNTSSNHAFAQVVAYGSQQNKIHHFAKVTDWSADGTPLEINSKWGGMEVIHSTSVAPFTSAIAYGNPLLYFNKINNNNASICYNPVTNTYYDSNYKTWNSSNNSYGYVDVLSSIVITHQNTAELSGGLQCSSELSQIYERYRNKIDDYSKSIPDYNSISYILTDDENGAAKELIISSKPYLNEVLDIAAKGGYENFDSRTAQFIIKNIMNIDVFFSEPDIFMNTIKEQKNVATEAVKKYGSDITQSECDQLKEKYGYLIVPALVESGKLDLLNLDEDDIFNDINELVAFCDLFM